MELGKEAKRYRKQFLDQAMAFEDVHTLEDITFAWERSEYQWAHVVVPALIAYKKAHGDLNIVQNFIVPAKDAWPEQSWGLPLGSTVSQIRAASYFIRDLPGRRKWLEDQGFVFDAHKERWGEVQSALEQYHDLHGDLELPERYKVPPEEPWPEGMWGMNLGFIVKDIRYGAAFVRGNPERKQWLNDRTFRFETNSYIVPQADAKWESSVVPSLNAFQLVHGDLNVPQLFVVPSEEPWPEEAWGWSLGRATSNIRASGHYIRSRPERRQQLEGMGFVFDGDERRWEDTKSALKQYHEIHGHVDVKRSFVVPREDPWPEAMWDKRLGKSVNSIRSINTYDARDVHERRQWLEEHGFKWKMRQSGAERARAAAAHYGLEQAGTTCSQYR
jgi:hypothetical protein